MPSPTFVASVLLAPVLALAQQTLSPGASAQRCIQPQHGSMVEGTPVVLGACTSAAEQNLFFEKSGVVRVFSNQCITVPADAKRGDPLAIVTCNDSDATQQWTYDEAGKTLQNKGNGACMDLSHGDLAIGAIISFWDCAAGAANQLWSKGALDASTTTSAPTDTTTGPADTTSAPTDSTTGPADTTTTAPADTTSTVPVDTTSAPPSDTTSAPSDTTTSAPSAPTDSPGGKPIMTAKDNSKCLSAVENKDGAAVVLADCNGDPSQAWVLDGTQLVVHGDKCLDVTEGRNEKGTKLQIWTCIAGGSNQMFKKQKGDHIAWLNFDKCLDVTDGIYKALQPVQIWQCSSTTENQGWKFA